MLTKLSPMRNILIPILTLTLLFAPAMGGNSAERTNKDESATTHIQTSRMLKDWSFRHDWNVDSAEGWQSVRIPHDWAIEGPFDRAIDIQEVAVTQNGETTASWKTGRSGGLPWIGKGAYKTRVNVHKTERHRYELLFDGAMSEARVYVNRDSVGFWPYGYNSFYLDVTESLKEGDNEIVVLLENRPQSSRWYPGAGLYRKVRLIDFPQVHIPTWGVYITTPYASAEQATVCVETEVEGLDEGTSITLETTILDASGCIVARRTDTRLIQKGVPLRQNIVLSNPLLWSPDAPALYTARTRLLGGSSVVTHWGVWPERGRIESSAGEVQLDSKETRFGIRSIEYRPEEGFFLNGKHTMFKGVCLHHDLGALGAAVNRSAIRHQLLLLKEMGCNAVRTSHNMPAEELVELCDSLGLMLMVESFDEWDEAKCENGYHRYFAEWAEKDMVNMIRHYRSNPSVVMWSIGNEVPSQWGEHGRGVEEWLQNICHREDPTRPVTCGMDQFDAVMNNGFAAALDIPGFNYKVGRYTQAYPLLPQGFILGSETASTVSSRGIYHFPVESAAGKLNEDHQSSSYDLEYCSWSNIPDWDFAADEDYPWMLGQFVWTGFDYLGEPSPYDTDAWPNHSSVFGIFDLASLPKDRYWLYRSIWNTSKETLHVLPHWTWPGREGQVTPVYVYTSYPCAELFVNGKSMGKRYKAQRGAPLTERFRLMWDDVVYESGEIKAVAYDSAGIPVAEKSVRTALEGFALKIEQDPVSAEAPMRSGGEDLSYWIVSVVDRDGVEVPCSDALVKISVGGAASFEACANGDPTCIESFKEPQMHLFSGKLTLIVRSSEEAGKYHIKVTSKGLKPATAQAYTE